MTGNSVIIRAGATIGVNELPKLGKSVADVGKEVRAVNGDITKLSASTKEAVAVLDRLHQAALGDPAKPNILRRNLRHRGLENAHWSVQGLAVERNLAQMVEAPQGGEGGGGAPESPSAPGAPGGGGGLGAAGLYGAARRFLPWLGAGYLASKAIGAATSEMGPEQQRAIQLEAFRRSISATAEEFDKLNATIKSVGPGLALTTQEKQTLMMAFSHITGNTAPGALATAAGGNAAFARGFGLDTTATNAKFGSLEFWGANRDRSAVIIGETIARSGGTAKSDEILGALTHFSEGLGRQRMFGMSPEELAAAGSLMVGLTRTGAPGAAWDNSVNLMQTASQSIMGGGGGGEAGQVVLFRALQRAFGLDGSQHDALVIQELEQRGSTATISDIPGFGDWKTGKGKTVLDALMEELKRMGGSDDVNRAAVASILFHGNLPQGRTFLSGYRKQPLPGEPLAPEDRDRLAQIQSGDLGLDQTPGGKVMQAQADLENVLRTIGYGLQYLKNNAIHVIVDGSPKGFNTPGLKAMPGEVPIMSPNVGPALPAGRR